MPTLRFRQQDLNPDLVEADLGDAFTRFIHDILREDIPDLHRFPTTGKDGGIDLSHTRGAARGVIECKFVGDDSYESTRDRWRDVARNLKIHLAAPTGPTTGQSQYRPWYDQNVVITQYLFCVSSLLPNQARKDELRIEIQAFFDSVATRAHLTHLRALTVEVFDWSDLLDRVQRVPHLLFRWFPDLLPVGLTTLGIQSKRLGTFRDYLSDETLPYYSRRASLLVEPSSTIPDELDILRGLTSSLSSGLVVTGVGGVGKTRLMLEVARLAARNGWTVIRITALHNPYEVLTQLARRLRAGDRVLFVVDYIETQRHFNELVETIESLNEEYGFKLRYIANCRRSYYRAVQALHHEQLNISPSGGYAARWYESHQQRAVRHILEKTGITEVERYISLCRGIPVLAVFLSFLWRSRGEAGLNELLGHQSFGQWVAKRVQMSFQRSVGAELALMMALFPIGADAPFSPSEKRLIEVLANDGWLAKSDENGSLEWTAVHDVLADQIIVSHIQTIERTVDVFVSDTLAAAYRLGGLRSALLTFQRLADQAGVSDTDWARVFEREMDAQPVAWREVRDLLLRSGLVTTQQQLVLLEKFRDSVWKDAELERDFHGRIGWLTREFRQTPSEIQHGEAKATLERWLAKCVPHAIEANFVVNMALRLNPDLAKDSALWWIKTKPTHHQTHYLLVAWLEVGLPLDEIADEVRRWSVAFSADIKMGFLVPAWLRAGGGMQTIREPALQWLSVFKEHPDTSYFYRAWLSAGLDAAEIAEALEAWIRVNGRLSEARTVLTGWLSASTSSPTLNSAVAVWIGLHGLTEEAAPLLAAWLESGIGGTTAVEACHRWLATYAPNATAAPVFKAMLRTGVAASELRDKVRTWVDSNRLADNALGVYRSWLDYGGDREFVRADVAQWLSRNCSTYNAHLLMEAWLKRDGDPAVVRDALSTWLDLHGLAEPAGYLFEIWISKTTDVVRVALRLSEWLSIHASTLRSQYLYKTLLETLGLDAAERVRTPLRRWLDSHHQLLDASFVLVAWLRTTMDVGYVATQCLRWLDVHAGTKDAGFVLQAWLDAGGSVVAVEPYLSRYVDTQGSEPEAGHVYTAWLHQASDINSVQPHIRMWLDTNPPRADYVFNAWLARSGEAHLVQHAVVKWLAVNATEPRAYFAFVAWLRVGANTAVVSDAVSAWLQVYGETERAGKIYRLWLQRRGEPALIEHHVVKWLDRYLDTKNAMSVMGQWPKKQGRLEVILPYLLRRAAAYTAADDGSDSVFSVLARYSRLSPQALADILDWCGTHPHSPFAITALRRVGMSLLEYEDVPKIVAVAEAVIRSAMLHVDVLDEPHAITMAFSFLLCNRHINGEHRVQMLSLFAEWVVHPSSFGTIVPVPTAFQRPVFPACVLEALELRLLDATARAGVLKFVGWVTSWHPRHRSRVSRHMRAIDVIVGQTGWAM